MPTNDTQLHLHEEILLLALNDEKGTIHSRAGMWQYAMAAGILEELLLAERIAITRERKKNFVDVISERPVGDPILDESLTLIANAKRRARLQTWITRLTRLRDLRHRVAAELCRRRILREDEGRILFIFTRRLYPERDPRHERRIIERLRKAIFTNTRKIDPRTAILVSLANSINLLKIPFDKRELRQRKTRIAEISEGDVVGEATRAVIAAAQAAVVAATIAATTAATS